MFTESARHYDAIYDFKDYAAETDFLTDLIRSHRPQARSLLDVGCGTGRHLEGLARAYEVEGLDISRELLAQARARCPNMRLHEADMANFSLPRRFDVIVSLFSTIAYLPDTASLRATLGSMRAHMSPGGLLIIEPWFTPETYWTNTITANHFFADPEKKVAWMYTSERAEDVAVQDMHFLVGTPEGIDHFTERHELYLFSEAEYRSAIEATGLRVVHDPEGFSGRGLYMGFEDGQGSIAP